MIALTTAVAIAVTCSVIFIVTAVVSTIIWTKIRQERKSLALIKATPRPYANGLSTFPAETLTELSREEGSALKRYGQLPYGRPTEWGLLASRETLDQATDDKPTIKLLKKTRSFSLKHSLSTKSMRQQPTNVIRPISLRTLTETSERPSSHGVSESKEELVVSAVDGVMELPAETTPRQTPEREERQPITDNATRPGSGGSPLNQHKERSSGLFPVFEDCYQAYKPDGTRGRGGSIASQAPGTAPDQPVPPPPCAYPPNRFRLSKSDSLRYSFVSLETADSSILDDSRSTSMIVDGSFISPALPPCPMFTPFSANDVGRGYDRRTIAGNAAPFVFPPNSPARKGRRVDSERSPPRRSLTACSPTRSTVRISPPPRRSESLSAKQSLENAQKPYLDLDHVPPLRITPRNSSLLTHFSQMQRHSMHDGPRRDNDPFYNGTGPASNQRYTAYNPGRRASSLMTQGASSQSLNSHPKPPLASAMKSSGHRKGHRRQNCVRISIHPPITFAGPTFSPMVEEPEESEEEVVELDIRQSGVSDLSATSVSRDSSVSAISTTQRSSTLGPQTDRPTSRIVEVPNDTQKESSGSPVKKKRQAQRGSVSAAEKEKALLSLVTSLPANTEDDSISHTPSPERNPPAWKVSDYQGSPTTIEDSIAPGSPRRSAVMGPRNPPKPVRNSYQSLISSEDTSKQTSSPPSTRPSRTPSQKKHQQHQQQHQQQPGPKPARAPTQASFIRRVKSEAKEQTPPRSKSQSDRNRASHYTITTSSSTPNTNAGTVPGSGSGSGNGNGNGNGTGPNNGPPRSPSKIPGAQVSAIVPIYEDRDVNKSFSQTTPRRSTVSLVYDPPKSSSQSPEKKGPSQTERMARMASYRNKHGNGHGNGAVTPKKKTVGLGIGATAATPGSLYDGDGFLKE
ncbi:hypothetical protein BDV19DRAFT_350346 [Aspergillus venezuelensis]